MTSSSPRRRLDPAVWIFGFFAALAASMPVLAGSGFGPAQGQGGSGASSLAAVLAVGADGNAVDQTNLGSLTTAAGKTVSSPTVTATTAVVLGAATTAGVRLDLESGDLAVREGDDSAYANAQALGVFAADGSSVAPSFAFRSAITSGMYYPGVNSIGLCAGNTRLFMATVSGPGVMTFGQWTAGSYLTQKVADAGVGNSNRGGTHLALKPGEGTGSGAASHVAIYASEPTTSGGTLHALLARKVIGGHVTLADNVATTICTIALASGARVGGTVTYSIDATDGTDHQVRSGSFDFAVVDKAGVLTSQITEHDTQAVAASAGTLTDVWTVSDGTNAISLQLAADSSLTPSSMILRFSADLFGAAATVTVP